MPLSAPLSHIVSHRGFVCYSVPHSSTPHSVVIVPVWRVVSADSAELCRYCWSCVCTHGACPRKKRVSRLGGASIQAGSYSGKHSHAPRPPALLLGSVCHTPFSSRYKRSNSACGRCVRHTTQRRKGTCLQDTNEPFYGLTSGTLSALAASASTSSVS